MRKLVGTLVLAAVLLTQPGCLELMVASDGSSPGSYATGGSYLDVLESWVAPYSDSYYDEAGYYTDEWAGDYWVEDEFWYDDGLYYDEWYYYDEFYDEWYYYDPYYDEWYYEDEYYEDDCCYDDDDWYDDGWYEDEDWGDDDWDDDGDWWP
ncbi:MAG: hypothetical protein KKI02_01630 [Planctomycetes bacterium]|nr:hypothetical protein [Planctomycetota bacterium]